MQMRRRKKRPLMNVALGEYNPLLTHHFEFQHLVFLDRFAIPLGLMRLSTKVFHGLYQNVVE